MPRKAGYRHIDETRDKIKATQIINRLMKHVESDTPIMDASQVNAAKALLSKVLPDLSAVDLSGQMESTNYVVNGAPMSEQDWVREHAADD